MIKTMSLITKKNKLTPREFKNILGRYDMLKDDRDKLSAMFEYHSEVIDNAANIHIADLNYFASYANEGNLNTIDFTDINNYTTLNAIYGSKDVTIYGTRDGAIKELRKILKTYTLEFIINNAAKMFSVDESDNILFGCFTPTNTEEVYTDYPNSKLCSIMNYMLFNNKSRAIINPTIGINGLFYYTSDCNPKYPMYSRAESYPSEERSNVLYHIHLVLSFDYFMELFASFAFNPTEDIVKQIDKALTDEVVAQCPFMFCINTTEIPVGNNAPTIYLHDRITLPYALESYELTTIINDVDKYDTENYSGIKPWAKQLNLDGNDIVEATIYLPNESGIKHIVIQDNQITQIVKV